MPMPRLIITTMEATPMTMPNTVSTALSFLRHRLMKAVLKISVKRI